MLDRQEIFAILIMPLTAKIADLEERLSNNSRANYLDLSMLTTPINHGPDERHEENIRFLLIIV